MLIAGARIGATRGMRWWEYANPSPAGEKMKAPTRAGPSETRRAASSLSKFTGLKLSTTPALTASSAEAVARRVERNYGRSRAEVVLDHLDARIALLERLELAGVDLDEFGMSAPIILSDPRNDRSALLAKVLALSKEVVS